MSEKDNDHLILIASEASSGKTASLSYLKNPEGVMYFNCEGKKPSFRNCKFEQYKITDPLHIPKGIAAAEKKKHVHTIVVDSLTYMMNMFETLHVLPSKDTRKAWSDYSKFFNELMLDHCAKSTKNIIFLAHTLRQQDEETLEYSSFVKVKGALQNVGIESFFGIVVKACRVSTKKLEKYQNDYLHITEEDQQEKFKYVFQTRLTEDTRGERIRSPMGMWSFNETFIDNNAQYLIDRLDSYYNE